MPTALLPGLRSTTFTACIAGALSLGTCIPALAGLVTNCNDSGPGSFREQVSLAGDGELVELGELTCSLITLTSGEVVTRAQTIDIHGSPDHRVVIDAANHSRILRHDGYSNLDIENLTFINGKYSASSDASGGCIRSKGHVQLIGDALSNCQVVSTGTGDAKGGAVYGLQGAVLYSTTISGNFAISDSADARGGGVYSGYNLRTNHAVTLSGNTAVGATSCGGGAFTLGDVFLQHMTVSGNSADIGGGLCLHFGTQSSPNLLVSQITVSGNTATSSVGGVFSRAPLNLLNSTVTDNTEAVQAGAGVYVEGASQLDSTIVSGNHSGSTPMDIGGSSGASVTGSHNLIGIPGLAMPSDTVFSNNPGLGPLADNGGATLTHLPAFNSLAVNHGHEVGNLMTDQRDAGFPRSVDGAIDIGAIEYNDDIIFVNGFN